MCEIIKCFLVFGSVYERPPNVRVYVALRAFLFPHSHFVYFRIISLNCLAAIKASLLKKTLYPVD